MSTLQGGMKKVTLWEIPKRLMARNPGDVRRMKKTTISNGELRVSVAGDHKVR